MNYFNILSHFVNIRVFRGFPLPSHFVNIRVFRGSSLPSHFVNIRAFRGLSLFRIHLVSLPSHFVNIRAFRGLSLPSHFVNIRVFRGLSLRVSLFALCSLLLALSFPLSSSAAIVNTFARYKVIINRRPFGEPPAKPIANLHPEPEIKTGPSFVDSLKMCAVTRSGPDTRVGFFDTRAKPPKTYYLYVGEEEDGIKVIEASYEGESALLLKQGEERWLRMQSLDSSRDEGTLAAATGSSSGSPNAARSRTSGSGSRQRLSPARRKRMAIREQRRLAAIARREKETEETIAQRKAELREKNLNYIRAGMPALPLTLTQEEDDQLVAEGILAPQE